MSKQMEKKFRHDVIPKNSFLYFDDLRSKNKLCDVTIRVESRSISAHRIVLTAVIPYFRNIFCNDCDEPLGGITIPDVEPDALVCLIDYAYRCEVNINPKNVKILLAAACHLGVEEVQEACSEFLCDMIELENSLNIHALASSLGCSNLLKTADHYIRENFNAVSETTDFLNCDVTYLRELLTKDDLNVDSEKQVLNAILSWAKECPQERQNELPELLVRVRMTLLDPLDLTDIVETEELIQESIPCRNVIDEARNYNLFPQRRKTICSFQTQPREKKETITDNSCIYKFFGQAVHTVQQFDVSREKWITGESRSFFLNAGSAAELQGKMYFFYWGDALQFNAINNKFKYIKNVPTARVFTGAVTFKDKIYVCGGRVGDSVASKAVESFNPREDDWTRASLMPTGRWALSAVTLGEYIYLIGGKNNSSVFKSMERYDPERNKWTCMSPMLTKRFSFGAASLNGKIYVCGGRTSLTAKKRFIKTAEVYDPVENTWAFIAPMNSFRNEFTLLSYQEKLYAIGGKDGEQNKMHNFEIYNLERSEWTLGPSTDPQYSTSSAVVM